ncbi:MAG TPA: hypothetical protein PKA27_14930 [Fimbriimonadaceae bacterium]|nr:hypothetical protein [Fimbriimonadaceae bacterium]
MTTKAFFPVALLVVSLGCANERANAVSATKFVLAEIDKGSFDAASKQVAYEYSPELLAKRAASMETVVKELSVMKFAESPCPEWLEASLLLLNANEIKPSESAKVTLVTASLNGNPVLYFVWLNEGNSFRLFHGPLDLDAQTFAALKEGPL